MTTRLLVTPAPTNAGDILPHAYRSRSVAFGQDYSVGFLPTPAIAIGFRRRYANGYTGYFINDTVRSYRKNRAAFMVSRLCVKG
ncbi:hypothetical protein [Moorena sp. SIO4G3]|uniref:hypothetical protein n=1 Tax=Moorena sp. SIO4G3 TaxID=2607821 RepID=UPI00142D009E|nr:hypothetical protein [Moorena sp. SIO4G3]NEO77044.1 hypothetical protein [Moorena sp. SIO4G3]